MVVNMAVKEMARMGLDITGTWAYEWDFITNNMRYDLKHVSSLGFDQQIWGFNHNGAIVIWWEYIAIEMT